MSKKKQTKRTGWSLVTFEAIEERRKATCLPRYAMAEALGVSNGTYHNWQSGRAVPSPATQKRIREALLSISSKGSTVGLPADSARVHVARVQVESRVSQHAVATIVAAYLSHLPDRTVLSAEDLHEVTRGVMRTLGGARG